ncbi:MAG: hypothetical protein KGI59_02700 [Patescibacteria group bacterium]|nr:hypothetical protein [Patescibacteria group bacterium]MDE2172468.1 hypothetical protein [Patescibacteria group bacterium]
MKAHPFRMFGAAIGTVLLIVGAILLFDRVRFLPKARPVIFSSKDMLNAIWSRYKANYLEAGTDRTLDKQRGNITTSEGESYTMLRAVWMDDHATFDKSWSWTEDNLKQSNTHLFSWLFGQRPDGSYGILTAEKGQNTASDADTDIALALAFAYARWQDPKYLQASKSVISDIWQNEVVTINAKPYLAADNVEKNFTAGVLVNPSYFAPYAYRVFKQIDPQHDWLGLIDTSYAVLLASMTDKLGTTTSALLPPDWIQLGRTTAVIEPPPAGLDTNYGFDALRVPWRIALDWQWNKDPRAAKVLASLSFLSKEWRSEHLIYDTYAHDGTPADAHEVPAMYATAAVALAITDPQSAQSIYLDKLEGLYDPDTDRWRTTLGYYDDNWAWFGIGLYNSFLPNLWINM